MTPRARRDVDHLATCYPETAAGGFSRVDGAVDFYTRVAALVRPTDLVLNFGAGRGKHQEDPVPARRQLQDLRRLCRRTVGVDIDEAVLTNPALDEAHVVRVGEPLPLASSSVDIIVSDFTFEHVADPRWAAEELTRVLRPGGWICARTPNKWGYIGIGARAVPNRWHDAALGRLQPAKRTEDTFPTAYRLNTARALARYFPPTEFAHYSYLHDGEPAYAGGSRVGWRLFMALHAVTPPPLRSMRHVYLRKHPSQAEPGRNDEHEDG
jgi:SAM-dependent methyltransferase